MTPDYRASDFTPPLSPDAALMLEFVNEKRRRLRSLETKCFLIGVAGGLAGTLLGMLIENSFDLLPGWP